ncbi:MAG: hypothetical protein PVJ49_15245 [Acidobacteriota bacterium]|jgi:hypothetical protein
MRPPSDLFFGLPGAQSWAGVVRESQENVELTLRGPLRSCGIDPPLHPHVVRK